MIDLIHRTGDLNVPKYPVSS